MAATDPNDNAADRKTEATVRTGQLHGRVSAELFRELVVQAGPAEHVYIARDRTTGKRHRYGSQQVRAERDAAYAA
jgi:hypothetical protein